MVETDGDETIYLAVTTSGGYTGIYHTDPDCRAIENSRSISEKTRAVIYDHFRECQVCQGESCGGGSTTPHATQQLLESMDADEIGSDPSSTANGGGSA